MLSDYLFFGFAALALTAAASVVCARNPVRAALSLVLTFVAAAALWLIAQSEFLAIALVLVYVGAVMVLFLFVIMMLNIDMEEMKPALLKHAPLALVVAGGLAALLIQVFWSANLAQVRPALPAGYNHIAHMGQTLFTQFILPFEVAGVILLVAMVAAIALTFRGRQGGNKAPQPGLQVQVKKSDRLKIVRLSSDTQWDK